MQGPYEWHGADLLLNLKIQPKASQDGFMGLYGDALRIRITASPTDGKANEHLQRFLAKQFGVSFSKVEIISGGQSRHKVVRIQSPKAYPTEIQRLIATSSQ